MTEPKTDYPMGSISSGTMRSQDLLPAFLEALYDYGTKTVWSKIWIKIRQLLAEDYAFTGTPKHRWWDDGLDFPPDDHNFWQSEDCSWFINETLFYALNELAAPYFYFGSHPGNGSDYGFWPSEDLSQDILDNDGLIVSDTSEVSDDYSGEVLHVNDHGNCTLYSADKGKLTEVWAIV